jgi:photosystem II stability/assembly factor-like uncharacterized protein
MPQSRALVCVIFVVLSQCQLQTGAQEVTASERLQLVGKTPGSHGASQLEFIDANIGWLRTIEGLWTTGNGGAGWRDITPTSVRGSSPGVLDYFFVTAKQGWARTYNGLYRTSDAGQTWRVVQIPVEMAGGNGELDCIFPRHQGSAWIGGAIFRTAPAGESYFDNSAVDPFSTPLRVLRPAIFQTPDGGQTWWPSTLASDEYRLRKIFFTTRNHGLAATDKSIFVTTTGGQHWVRSKVIAAGPDADYRFNIEGKISDIFMLNDRKGWLAFSDGHICATHDGGLNWAELSRRTGTPGPNSKIFFISESLGWGLDAMAGKVFESSSAGREWKALDLGMRIDDLYVLDRQHAWILGDQAIFRLRLLAPQ